jgi:energy-converting hydrogenase Eha subunit G
MVNRHSFNRMFRFDFTRLRAVTSPRKPRHPLLRLACGLVGVALLAVMVFFGLFVGAAMIAGGMVFKLMSQRGKPASARQRVVEGEYHVVRKPVLPMGS